MMEETERRNAQLWVAASIAVALLAAGFACTLVVPVWRLWAPLPGETGWRPGFSLPWIVDVRDYYAALPHTAEAWCLWLWQTMVMERLKAGLLPHPAILTPLLVFLPTGLAVLVKNPFEFHLKGHGDARQATLKDLRRAGLLGSTGLILGEVAGRFIRMPETLSAMLLAPPGSGKTAGIAITNLVADWPDWRAVLGSETLGRFLGMRSYCRPPSWIVNDPKGELYEATSAYWRRRGWNVVKLAWAEGRGQRWNPLSPDSMPGGRRVPALRTEILELLAAVYDDATDALSGILRLARDRTDWQPILARDPGADGVIELRPGLSASQAARHLSDAIPRIVELIKLYADREQYVRRLSVVLVDEKIEPHWRDKGRAALQGCALFTIYRAERLGEEPSFGRLIDWMTEDRPLNHAGASEDDDPTAEMLRRWIAEAELYGYPARIITELSQLAATPGKERGSVLSTMDGGIDIFKLGTVRDRTASCDFALEDLRFGDKPTVVYLVVPLEDAAALGKVSGIFFESAAARFISQDAGDVKRRGRPVIFLADEFWTLPAGMESLMQIPALGRGQQVQLLLIGQAYNQIALRLNREAVGILRGASATQIVLQQNDHESAKVISEIIGNETVRSENINRQHGLGKNVEMFSWSSSAQTTGRPLFPVQRLMSLKRFKEQVVVYQGMANRPILSRTPAFFLNRRLKARVADRKGFVSHVESGLTYEEALRRHEAETNAAIATSIAREDRRIQALNDNLPAAPEEAGRQAAA